MKIRFLGTAAAEGIPALFCSCEKCQKARRVGGKNIRKRSQALIDDSLLIDLGPDLLANSIRFNIDLNTISHCLITHDHEDHFYDLNLVYIRKGFSAPPADWTLRVYGNEEITAQVENHAAMSGGQLQAVHLLPFQPVAVGNYTVTALRALHGTPNPYVYAISDGERSLLYAHDTDLFPEETWQYLANSGLHFDLVTMDCTEGALEDIPYPGHMCLGRNLLFRQKLREIGVADENTVFVSNHFSHNGKDACYDDYAPQAAQQGLLTSYDGMEIEF